VGEKEAGSRFIAITDPGSKMQQVAEADKFRKIFFGVPSIGGRYSALSNFGMVPAAVMGLGVAKFLNNTQEMVQACGATSAADVNPGVILGAILGVAANHGRDKITIVTSPGISDLGAWLEQLIAESTGKIGKGIIPVDRERLAKPAPMATIASLPICAWLRSPTRPRMPPSLLSRRPGTPWCGSRSRIFTILARNSFAGKSRPLLQAPSSALMLSTSPTLKQQDRDQETDEPVRNHRQSPTGVAFLREKGVKLFADEKNTATLKAARTLPAC